MGYLNGGFGSEGRLDLGNIDISSMLSKPSFATNTYIEDIPYIGFIDIKIKRRLEINFLKIEKSTMYIFLQSILEEQTMIWWGK